MQSAKISYCNQFGSNYHFLHFDREKPVNTSERVSEGFLSLINSSPFLKAELRILGLQLSFRNNT